MFRGIEDSGGKKRERRMRGQRAAVSWRRSRIHFYIATVAVRSTWPKTVEGLVPHFFDVPLTVSSTAKQTGQCLWELMIPKGHSLGVAVV